MRRIRMRAAGVVLAAVSLLYAAPPANAAFLLSGTGGTSAAITVNFTFGYGFTVGPQDLQVSRLGLWDSGSDGLADSHLVTLWTSGGTQLGQVTVSAGTTATLVNGFRYADLASPVTLIAGQTYVLGAYYPTYNDTFIYNSVNTINTQLVFNASAGTLGDALYASGTAFPTNADSYYDIGANMEFTAVSAAPTPPGVLLALSGILSLGGFGWLRRRKPPVAA